MGMSRSAASVVAYLMKYENRMKYFPAMYFARKQRSQVAINYKFKEALLLFEKELGIWFKEYNTHKI